MDLELSSSDLSSPSYTILQDLEDSYDDMSLDIDSESLSSIGSLHEEQPQPQPQQQQDHHYQRKPCQNVRNIFQHGICWICYYPTEDRLGRHPTSDVRQYAKNLVHVGLLSIKYVRLGNVYISKISLNRQKLESEDRRSYAVLACLMGCMYRFVPHTDELLWKIIQLIFPDYNEYPFIIPNEPKDPELFRV
ncbi:hypothetical protein BDA99DRAFT_570499 [Phascolomyces articulosus]|uniref:Uncharacterized protein n=1 Tax=Phascolomyces articulosus TaxID=60185 RepID=A0AAD5PH83_9FUNG|nr:hypothetical protein BDA99DRAFT_570499 [Phascolomyces articulosus]